jgi:hypothetical protein
LAGGVGETPGAGFDMTRLGFCRRCFLAVALLGGTALALVFDAGPAADFGFDLAEERDFTAFARLAAFVLAREDFAFADTDVCFFRAALVGFRLGARFVLETVFRVGARPAAGLPRLVVFAMVLASIPPAGSACGHRIRAAARLQFKRAF